jgi:DNA processing protein
MVVLSCREIPEGTEMSIAEPISPPDTQPAPLPESERMARLRLARSVNVGPRTYSYLLGRFGDAARALDALPSLAAAGGKRDYLACPLTDAEAEIEAGQASGAQMVLLGEAAYPTLLAAIDHPPPVLWASGRVELLHRPAIAIVGARNASALGLRTARSLARGLGEAGQMVVSGLARGIDAAAHEAAMDTGTIAVMAGGIDQIYPPEHDRLAVRIAETGALVSECPMGVEPTSRHFPRRNRLISGLARGTVLVEAATRSGSLITARYVLEQGREAMACPGAPEDPRAGGCNQLIRDGAALIRNVDDVFEALSGPRTLGLSEPGREFLFDDDTFGEEYDAGGYDAIDDFDGGDQTGAALADQILRLLGPHPVELDEIARQCGASPAEFSLAVLELDLAGRIDLVQGGMIASTDPAG